MPNAVTDTPFSLPTGARISLGQGTTFLPSSNPPPHIQPLIAQVLRDGYIILPSLFTPSQVSLALAELTRLEAAQSGPASAGGRNPFEGFLTRRVYALADKSRAFDCFATHETVLALNDYFLQEFYLLSSLHTVNVLPGSVEQMMHTDDGLISLPRPRPLMGIGTMVALDDFTASNGATTLIPGSHLWSDADQPTRAQAIPMAMPAGSMLYFLNTVWHGAGANTSTAARRSLTVQYCQPWIRPYENMTVAVGWEDLDSIPKKMLELVGLSVHKFAGHVDGRSPRWGVEERKRRLLEGRRDTGGGMGRQGGSAKL